MMTIAEFAHVRFGLRRDNYFGYINSTAPDPFSILKFLADNYKVQKMWAIEVGSWIYICGSTHKLDFLSWVPWHLVYCSGKPLLF